tara:strand:+ start:159 stop:1133 length:975 start_codon:yes stop_codon:yes gene_type:complete
MKNFKHIIFFSILCSLELFTNCGENSANPIGSDTTSTTDNSSITVFDADGDGVVDADDTCAYTAEGLEVDENGCTNSQLANLSGYNYNFKDLLNPPYDGTIFISGNIITQEDTSTYDSIVYTGMASRTMYDRRDGGAWITIEPHIFSAFFRDGPNIEIQINPEFTLEEAQLEATKYAFLVGQLPIALRKDVETIWIHKGIEGYGGGNNNILVHTGMTASYEAHYTGNITEETLIHEAAHTSIDAYCYNDPDWADAVQKDDSKYISSYAKEFPNREDIAELFPLYVAIKYFPERINQEIIDNTLNTSLYRILYFDKQEYDMTLYQ